MQSTTTRRHLGAALATATLTVTALAVGVGAAGAHEPPTDPTPTPRTGVGTVGVYTSGAPLTPPPPQRLTASGLRPLTRAESDRLKGAVAHHGWTCDIDFDDDAAIALLPANAVDTFALSPWWNQLCGGDYARVYPTDVNHFHLGYVDSTIGPCIDPENPHDTPPGTFSRGEDCEPIDPVTEPRSDIHTHFPWNHIRLDLIDPIGSGYKPQPFTLERVRVLQAPVRICYRMPPEGPWVVAEPVGPFDLPGLVYCWASLSPGLWDLSDWTVGTVDVSFTEAAGDVWGLDDIRLG